MRIIFTAFLFSILMMTAGNAQLAAGLDGGERMALFQQVEEQLLRGRDALVQQEADVEDPIWVEGEDGSIHVIDGVKFRQRAEGFIFTAQALGLEQLVLDTLPPELRFMIDLLGEGGRADIAANRLMERYRQLSKENRRKIFSNYEIHLERVREAFFAAKRDRDAQAGGNSDTGSDSAGSGITVNQSRLALSGVQACSAVDLTSGRKWLFRNPEVPGASTYFEVSGFICRGDGVRFFERNDQSLTAFSCTSNWSECARDTSLDAAFTPPTRNSQLAGDSYTVWTLDWESNALSDWDLWIQD